VVSDKQKLKQIELELAKLDAKDPSLGMEGSLFWKIMAVVMLPVALCHWCFCKLTGRGKKDKAE
jgi:hypothetical protein